METTTIFAFNEQGQNAPMTISIEDCDRIPRSGNRGSCVVTDQTTGEQVKLRRASCGLPRCMCALAVEWRKASN